MSEKFTSEALFGWQENGGEKKKIFKGTKALKPRLFSFSFFGYLKIQEISSNVLCSSILL